MRKLPWVLLSVFVGLAAAALVLAALNGEHGDLVENLVFALVFMAFGVVGALVASERPRNVIGWLFLAIWIGAGTGFISGQYAVYGLVTDPGSLPLAVWGAWVSSWSWMLFIGPVVTFLPLLFPSGTLPSPRWRPYPWVVGAFLVVMAAIFAVAPTIEVIEGRSVENPLGVEGSSAAVALADGLFFFAFLALAVVSFAALVLRFRRGLGVEREQIKWFVYAIGLLVGFFVLNGIVEAFAGPEVTDNWITAALAVAGFISLPIGAGIGILRHRLFDVDVVISKTVAFGALAAFVTALYVAVVVGLGAAVGSRGNLGLSILATALIAVAFQPVRERARHFANRLVYGKRATPYEVLAAFSERMGGTYSMEDILPQMARILGEGTGGSAHVWLRVGDALHREASWSPKGDEPERHREPPLPVPLDGDSLPSIPGALLAVPVRHQGELLGALSVSKPGAESLTPVEEKLMTDLAAQAGLVLRNVRLAAELLARLDELRASRQRLVRAQDEERRRLERNIHDGAQQQLVSLAVHVRLLEDLVPRDPARAVDLAGEVRAGLQDAVETLRDLARGIYPPLLADAGLVAALRAQVRKAALPVEIESDGVGRYPEDTEAAVYFCCLEALQNVAKYAEASRAVIRLREDGDQLLFEVADDGRGFDPAAARKGTGLQGMADRLSALGGELLIESNPGQGTSIKGRLPVPA